LFDPLNLGINETAAFLERERECSLILIDVPCSCLIQL
jgi:hypothetical protein